MEDQISSALKSDIDIIIKKAAGNSTEIDEIENWGIGALNSCYKITIKNSSMKFFLKIENDNIIPTTRRGQIEREVKGIELMNSVGIPCPVILRCDCSRNDTGRKYMLQEFIESDLLWEIQNSLTPEENEYIKKQITDILQKMQSIRSDCYGDIYENGVIGQHPAWKDAYSAMWTLLLGDAATLCLLSEEELGIISDAGQYALTQLAEPDYASFNHGDLGKHNVLAGCAEGFRCIGTVIDFGNSSFTPFYMNEDGVRKHGGWDIEAVDVCEKYSVRETDYDLNNLLFDFESIIFFSMLDLRAGSVPQRHTDRLLDSCRQILHR